MFPAADGVTWMPRGWQQGPQVPKHFPQSCSKLFPAACSLRFQSAASLGLQESSVNDARSNPVFRTTLSGSQAPRCG